MLEIPAYTEKTLSFSLSLSAFQQKSVKLLDIRKREDRKGIQNQDIILLEALKKITKAEVKKDSSIFFSPTTFDSSPIRISANSPVSLPDFFLPLLPLAKKTNLKITACGITDTEKSSLDFLQYSLLPLSRKHGLKANLKITKRGFYPKNKGQVTLTLLRSKLKPIKISNKGKIDYIKIITNSRGFTTQAIEMEKLAKFHLKNLAEIDIQRNHIETKENKGASISLIAYCENLPFFSYSILTPKRNPEKTVLSAIELLKKKLSLPIDPLLLDYFLVHTAIVKKGVFPYTKTEIKELSEVFFNISFTEKDNLISL